MHHQLTLLMSEVVTHDVKRYITTRPEGFDFEPGQAVELAIDVPNWHDAGRPFTPTSVPVDQVLEFTIKTYPERNGVTAAMAALAPGAPLRMSDPFGAIQYKGPGVFIAGGAGLTPLVAILRERSRHGDLERQRLIFSNKTTDDILLEHELRHLLDERCVLTTTRSHDPGYDHGRISESLLEAHVDDFDQPFYVCGPPGFTESVGDALEHLGAEPERLVVEN